MKLVRKIALFFLCLLGLTACDAKNRKSMDKDVDLIMFMGQSNMAGRGVMNDSHPEDAPAVEENVAMEFRAYSDPSRLYPVTKLFGRTEDNVDGINDHDKKSGSMVPAFVNACYAETKVPVIAVSASEGGTRTAQWLPGKERLNDAAARLLKTREWLAAHEYRVRHCVMVWTQGESDGDKHVSGSEYKRNLRKIVSAMKNAGVEHCYVVRIGKYNGRDKSISYETVRQAQEEFCAENDDCTMVSWLFASFKEKGMMKDSYHYYQDAYNIVGKEAGCNVGKELKGW